MPEGYGSGEYGSSQYGVGVFPPPPTPPRITPLSPVDGSRGVPQLKPLTFRLGDDVGIAIGTLRVSVDGELFVIGGVAQGEAVISTVLNDDKGYDVEVKPPGPYSEGARKTVVIHVANLEGVESTLTFYFSVGVGPRLIFVRNPVEGVLLAHFNQPMTIDSAFLFAPNWEITPVSEGAAPIQITEVVANTSQPDVAHIRYTGGGSVYLLSVLGITAADGSPLERGFGSFEFDLVFGQEETPQHRLFNSVFGPLGISQRSRKRRHIDDFVANRSIALALDEQLRLRFQQLDNTVGRDGRDGKRRTT